MPRTGRPPKEPGEILTERIEFRMLPEEKADFERAAELAGVKLSAWMRDRLQKSATKEIGKAAKPRKRTS